MRDEADDESESYEIAFTPAAKRDLKGLRDQILLRRIDAKIQSLKADPRPSGVEPLEGESGSYRVRVGDYRVLYKVLDGLRKVAVTRIRHRSDVYRHM